MMKKKTAIVNLRKALSLFLIVAILYVVGGTSALAENVTEPVVVMAADGETVSEEVGSITISDATGESAAEVVGKNGGNASLTANNISISGNDTEWGVSGKTYDDSSKVSVVVNGSITASSDSGFGGGVIADSSGGGSSVNIEVNGNVSASAQNVADGIDAYARAEGGSVTVKINGNIESISEASSSRGVELTFNNGKSDIIVTGSIDSTGNNYTEGIAVWTNTGDATIKVDKDVTAKGTGEGQTDGIYTESRGGKTSIQVGENVMASGGGQTNGVWAQSNGEGSKTEVKIDGDITAESTGSNAIGGFFNSNDGGSLEFEIGGTIMAKADKKETSESDGAVGIEACSSGEGSEIKGMVKGDVTGGSTGLLVDVGENETGIIDVIIEGTLSAEDEDGHAVIISENVTEDNLKLTVWKIDLDKNGNAVVQSNNGDMISNKTTKAIEKDINYIIKVEPTQADIFAGTQETAKEGEKVLVKLNIPDGYKVDGAFTDEGKSVKLMKDNNGNYYVEMPKGGGVYLCASLSPIPAEVISLDVGNYATVKIIDGKYVLFLTGWQKSMTFIRSTLERYAKLSDTFIVKTDMGSCAVSLFEILNFNEKAINFQFSLSDESLEIFVDYELAKTIGFAEFV